MSAQSVYVIPCLCGATVKSEERETRCEKCGRLLVIEWGKLPTESEVGQRANAKAANA